MNDACPTPRPTDASMNLLGLALLLSAALLIPGLSGCASSGGSSSDSGNGMSGNVTAICAASIAGGTAVGGIAGRAIGDMAGSKTAGTIIGAAVGAGGGIAICRRAWKQAQELERRLEQAEEQEAAIAKLEADQEHLLEQVNSGAESVDTEKEALPPPPTLDRDMEVVGQRAVRFDLNSSLLFASGSSALQPKALQPLGVLSESLQENPKSTVKIIGHTDDAGSKTMNQRLSEARARAVVEFLSSKGVSSARLESVGRGETEPAFPNSNTLGRAKNRRVEVIIIPTSA